MSQKVDIYFNHIDTKKIQKYLEQNKESNSVSWRLIKIRDDKQVLLNKKYGAEKNESGDYPIGKRIYHNEEYDKEYEVIQNNFNKYYEKNTSEGIVAKKELFLTIYEFLLLDNLNPRFNNELTESLKQDDYVDIIKLKAKTEIDYVRLDLSNSPYYHHEVTNEHVLARINHQKKLFKYAKLRAKNFFNISLFDIKFHICAMKYKNEYINYLQDYFYNRRFN